jgi:hexosaminidase
MEDGTEIYGGPSCSALNPALDETYNFVKNIIKDLSSLFPESDFLHLGGDEVNKKCWSEDKQIQEFMKEKGLPDIKALFKYFNFQVSDIANGITKQNLGHWTNEAEFYVEYDDGDYIQYWGSTENIDKLKTTYPNNKHILSPVDYFYLDCGYGNRYGIGKFYCDPVKTFTHMVMFEPTDYYEEGDEHLVGAEACMWSEMNTPVNVFNKVFPRIGAFAEIFWSPKQDKVKKWDEIVTSLVSYRDHLQDNGIPANKVGSRYCEENADVCFKKYEQHLRGHNLVNS